MAAAYDKWGSKYTAEARWHITRRNTSKCRKNIINILRTLLIQALLRESVGLVVMNYVRSATNDE
eukprot:35177-Amphidinium_carterae.1